MSSHVFELKHSLVTRYGKLYRQPGDERNPATESISFQVEVEATNLGTFSLFPIQPLPAKHPGARKSAAGLLRSSSAESANPPTRARAFRPSVVAGDCSCESVSVRVRSGGEVVRWWRSI